MKKTKFLIFSCAAFFWSCTFFLPQDTFTVYIPNGSCDLKYFTTDGIPVNQVCYSPKVQIEVINNSVLPVMAFYSTNENPEGLIFPFQNQLSMHGGFCAEILYTLICSSMENGYTFEDTLEFLNHFNWNRFILEIEKFDDPWNLNKEIILKAIAAGTFKKTDLQLIRKNNSHEQIKN